MKSSKSYNLTEIVNEIVKIFKKSKTSLDKSLNFKEIVELLNRQTVKLDENDVFAINHIIL